MHSFCGGPLPESLLWEDKQSNNITMFSAQTTNVHQEVMMGDDVTCPSSKATSMLLTHWLLKENANCAQREADKVQYLYLLCHMPDMLPRTAGDVWHLCETPFAGLPETVQQLLPYSTKGRQPQTVWQHRLKARCLMNCFLCCPLDTHFTPSSQITFPDSWGICYLPSPQSDPQSQMLQLNFFLCIQPNFLTHPFAFLLRPECIPHTC